MRKVFIVLVSILIPVLFIWSFFSVVVDALEIGEEL